MPSRRPTPSTPDAAFITAVELLLRPLARLFLEEGLVFGTAEELLKTAYVRVADAEYRLRAEPPTDSRVSVLSGVHRKDVHRIRYTPEDKPKAIAVPLASEVVTRWISDPRYLDARGSPRVLPRAADPPAASFDGLVRSISKDVRPRVLLDELVRLGVAGKTGDGGVEMLISAFVSRKDRSQKLFFFGRNMHDHLAACVQNLLGREPSMMEQNVFSFELSGASVEHVAEITRREWKEVAARPDPRARRVRGARPRNWRNVATNEHRDVFLSRIGRQPRVARSVATAEESRARACRCRSIRID